MWQHVGQVGSVGPLQDYIYSNSTSTSELQHNQHYPPEMARRNERLEFSYGPGTLQPNLTPQQQQQQQQHPGSIPPSMSTSQQPPNGPSSQQQTPTPTPAPTGRQRKRPAPNAIPSPGQGTAPPHAPAQTHGPGLAHTPPAPQSAASSAKPLATATEDANASSTAPPPAKKSRTNTPWTPEEEKRLKEMREAGKSWSEIAKCFPNRTEGSVKKHWYKDMHHAEFCEDESKTLLIAIKEYDSNRWKVIGAKVGKPAKACEQYAKEHFPDLFTNVKGR